MEDTKEGKTITIKANYHNESFSGDVITITIENSKDIPWEIKKMSPSPVKIVCIVDLDENAEDKIDKLTKHYVKKIKEQFKIKEKLEIKDK